MRTAIAIATALLTGFAGQIGDFEGDL